MRKTVIATTIFVSLAIAGLFTYIKLIERSRTEEFLLTEASRGNFEISITSSGELQANNYIDVMGPDIVGNFNFRAGALTVTDIVPEGTHVKKGDYIATIDRSAFSNTLKDEQMNLDRMYGEFDLKLIDTAVTLSTLRDDIKDQLFAVEEAAIEVERSLYEPPAVIRKAESEYESRLRHLDQKNRLYWLKMSQSAADVRNMSFELARQKRKVEDLSNILSSFTVKAPSDGIVIYKRDRLGKKIVSGSVLHPFNPVVATLPDMSKVVSRTYVSEVEVSRIREGMPVQVTVDALQGRIMEGTISHIANIGEQLSNSDSKVFEVLVTLSDNRGLLPSMSTGNKIVINSYSDVVYIPLESLHTGIENIPYVYTKEGTRQVVIPGASNEKYIIIEKGLTAGTPIYATRPSDSERFRLEGLDLVPETNTKSLAEMNRYVDSESQRAVSLPLRD